MLLGQFGNGAYLVSRFVGGEHMNRDHRGDPSARDPFIPVKAAKQREALKFLQEHVLSDKPFQFPPDLLRRLAVERWSHWGARSGSTDFPLYDRILGIQRIAVDELLRPEVLRRVQNNALKAGKDEQPLTVAEVFRALTDGVWGELPVGPPPPPKNGKESKAPNGSSIIRRNLQREHLRRLSELVLGQKSSGSSSSMLIILLGGGGTTAPPDARSLARMHLREIGKRIDTKLGDKQALVDDTTRAHLEECRERIAKVLGASMQVND
jgi:hypothetical protein